MSHKNSPVQHEVERRGWYLWFAAFSLILAFAATVHVLHLRLLSILSDTGDAGVWLRNGYFTGIGLTGLVFLFILYTALKQVQLHRLHVTLSAEESELEDLRTRLSELTTLFQLATALNLELSVDSILGIIVRRVVAALKAQQASIMLYNPKTELLETRAYYGVGGEFASDGKRRLGEGIAGWVAERQEAILLNDDDRNSEMKRHYKPERQITSALSVPLRVDSECVGVLNVNRISHPSLFNARQRDILRIFAEHVGVVIQRALTLGELQRKTVELERANVRLEEVNRMKDVFLSTASHELKTPLTSVIAYAEVLNDHAGKLSEEQNREFLGRLRGEADRLLGLIEDILDLTRLETGKIELKRQPMLLNQVIRTAVETVRPTAEKQTVGLEEDYDDEVDLIEVDEVKLRQAVVNLLVNAVKFSPEDGCVVVRTRCDGGELVVEVQDQGPGVSPGEVAQIFSLFGQGVRGTPRGSGGLGIGLHLVKAVVELHGGHVGVKSSVGSGSTFWIRLPRKGTSEITEAA